MASIRMATAAVKENTRCVRMRSCPDLRSRRLLRVLRLALLTVAIAGTGCAHLAMEPCENEDVKVLGNNSNGTARIRTSHHRALLAHPNEAAGRVLPYALMSAFAYFMREGCSDPGNRVRVDPKRGEDKELKTMLAQTTSEASPWTLDETLGPTSPTNPSLHGCEDDQGLMFHVWQRNDGKQTYVSVAFRGTSGDGDWTHANLWWLTRFFSSDNQYSRARRHMQEIINTFDERAAASGDPKPRFVTTGHSLGGGLAQHMLYAFPNRVEQAIVFDPTAVTAFADVDRDRQIAACSCSTADLSELGVDHGAEARILRVYETDEILVNLRFFHKLFFAPERHVQEVRFPINESRNAVTKHSMQILAHELFVTAGDQRRYDKGTAWLASSNESCTKLLIESQALSCKASSGAVCPQ